MYWIMFFVVWFGSILVDYIYIFVLCMFVVNGKELLLVLNMEVYESDFNDYYIILVGENK